jgi:rubredoxin
MFSSSPGGGRSTRTALPYAAGDRQRIVSDADTVTAQQYICTSCGFIYDPEEGDPDGGIPPGTPFEEIPDDWFCPVCGARKRDFELYEG